MRTNIGLVLLTVLVLGTPLFVVSGYLATRGVRSSVVARAESLALTLDERVAAGRRVALADVRGAIPTDWSLTLRRSDGTIESAGAPADDSMVSADVPVVGGVLTVRSPDRDAVAARGRAYALVLVAVLMSLAVGVVAAFITARRLAQPLRDLTERAALLGSGDFRTTSRRFGIVELDGVADVLDAAAAQVAEMLARERELAADVSHQLRTRLTGIQLRLDALVGHPDAAVREEVEAAICQTERLVTVVDDLLAAARSRRAAGTGAVDLGALLDQVAADWLDAFGRAGRVLDVVGGTDVQVRATPVRLRESLGVLLDNALAHGAGPVRVRVTEHRDRGAVSIEVSDSGPGIPDRLSAHVFDRGVSGASSSGIGLGLARAFVEADGGRLELRRTNPAVFGIVLSAIGGAGKDDAGGR